MKSDLNSPVVLAQLMEEMLFYEHLKKVDLYFFNYKRSFSIVLLALCHAFCQSTVADIAVVDTGEAPKMFTLIICITLIILHVYTNVFINFTLIMCSEFLYLIS